MQKEYSFDVIFLPLFVILVIIETLVYGISLLGNFGSSGGSGLTNKCLDTLCNLGMQAVFGQFFLIITIIPIKILFAVINFIKRRFIISSFIAIAVSTFNFLTISFVDAIFEFLPTSLHRGIVSVWQYIFYYPTALIFLSILFIAFCFFFFKEKNAWNQKILAGDFSANSNNTK